MGLGKKPEVDPTFVEQLAKQKNIGGKYTEMAMSPNFVVISDLRQLKIVTSRGAPRPLSQHEMLHLYLQRAEQARAEWTEVFGAPGGHRWMMVLVRSESTRKAFSQVHFGNSGTNLLYGGGKGKLGGLAGVGFILDGRDDDALHFRCRHMIGHLCIAAFHNGNSSAKYLPQWLFRGSAHWLCKTHPRARDAVYYCSFEGVTVNGSGKRWKARAAKIAARGPDRDPVERMLQAATAKSMNLAMHIRSWSWFEIFTKEEREPFVRFVRLLREAREPRLAAKEAWGQPPEAVDDRWRERARGKRRKVTASNKEKEKDADVDAATSRLLRSIGRETDVQLLASRIRGLDRCQNVRTARLLISLLDTRDSDRVREVIARVLSRTTDDEVRAFLRGKGFERADVRGDLAELNEQRRQVQREHSIAQRVVTLTDKDLATLSPLVQQAEVARLETGASRVVAVRFDNSTMQVDDARGRVDQITRTKAVYASRMTDAQRDLKYLDQQGQRLEALLAQLETERAEFQTQIWQLDRQVDAIARNDRLIGLMEKRQRTIDECSKYEVKSLGHLQVKMAEVRSRQEAELEMLASDQQRMDYEDIARLQLDTGSVTVLDPETAQPLVLSTEPLVLTEVDVIGPEPRLR